MQHGVEQELQVVNENGHLVYEVGDILDNIPQRYREYGKGGIYKDVYPSQLEIATDTCGTLEELEEQLIELREVINKAAQEADLFLIATGANPYTKGRVGEYFAEQHHIDTTSDKEKKKLNNFFRIFVPEIFAISTNSPVHNSHITKWKSVRASMENYDASKRVNPNIKKAPYLSIDDIKKGYYSGLEIEESFEKKRKKSRYFDVSPFTQKDRVTGEYKQTLEVRLLDTQPYIPLTIGYAALFQALAEKSKKMQSIPELKIGHNRNTAIKDGISSQFKINRKMKRYFHYKGVTNNSSVELVDAVDLVDELLNWIKPEINELGYRKQIKALKRFLKHKRNLADWQIHLFSKKKDRFVSELFQSTMENYDDPPLPEQKIKFRFVEKEEGREELEWDEDIKEVYDRLEKQIRRPYTIGFRELAYSLLGMKEVNPQMEESQSREMIESLIKKYSGSNFHYSLLLLETLFTYEETERDIYRKNAEKVTRKIAQGCLEGEDVWLSAYTLTVISKMGGEDLDRRKYAERLRERIGEDTPSWVRAYAVESFKTCGLDVSEELSNLKISLKDDHWECGQTDDMTATAIIYNCLSSIGYTNENVEEWLKHKLKINNHMDKGEILRTSLALRAISEVAMK